MCLNFGQPGVLDTVTKAQTFCPWFKWRIDDVFVGKVKIAVRVKMILKAGTDQYSFVVLEYIDSAVAMVNIKIANRDLVDGRISSANVVATAILLNIQKPIAAASSAWCPGGRMAQKALLATP